MARKHIGQTRKRRQDHRLQSAVSSGDLVGSLGVLFAALKPKKMSVKEIIIIMALAVALLAMAYVVVSAIRGEK